MVHQTQLKMYFKLAMFKHIICFSLIFISSHTFADSLSCGETNAVVTNATSANEPFFNLTLKNNAIHQSYQFDIQKDSIHIRCDKNAKGNFVFLINHLCSGSGCADLGNFGIIEAKTGTILLKPDKPFVGNVNKAKRILGKEIEPFACSKESGEICLHSSIELG